MNVADLKAIQVAEHTARSITYLGERCRGQRHTSALSGPQFAGAIILASRKLERGITLHTVIRELRVAQIFEVPMTELEWFNRACNETPEIFQ